MLSSANGKKQVFSKVSAMILIVKAWLVCLKTKQHNC